MTISRFIHVTANGIILFFLWLSNIPLYMCITSLYIPRLMAIVTIAAVNSGTCVSFQIMISSEYIPRTENAGSIFSRAIFSSSMFSFLRNLHTVLYSDYTNLHSHLLQEIFLTQGSNPGVLHWRQILYTLSNQESINTECIVSHYSCAFSYMLLLLSMIFLFCTCENLVLDLMEAIVLSSLTDMSNRKDGNCGV